ncbi:hypothetical protein HNO88_001602 [Novosphingobium chloroacetimidivorans]|uniref:ParB/Sulfiredoxin domain-containing protein n=1 Tax=Novosphingobium chloroacetimidivorans TaxID=1428314 RepID=A0A7W7K9X1_9SPHN|nr:hypothetical protein [Novosphingobium chloroacetimidivorans]MBB4858283.1 hypothetical protein [Novosphingobium chloroacetimidivorans]
MIVYFDGTSYWLADGFHRTEAHRLIGASTILADVRQGTQRDAVLYSVGANASHGYRRTNADKRRSALRLLNDPEWSAWSDREIARRCGVSAPLVASLRPEADEVNPRAGDVRTFRKPDGTEAQMQVAAIGKSKPNLPLIAGRRAEKKPDLAFATCDEACVPTAARITGLSTRNITELARAGEIDGAVKDGGSWVMPTASLVQLVETSRSDEPAPATTPPPAPMVYDHEAGELRLAMVDTIDTITSWPSVDRALATWASSLGGALDEQAVARAADWLADFAARWPALAAQRNTRIARLSQETERHVA